jgi:hypothetical protein
VTRLSPGTVVLDWVPRVVLNWMPITKGLPGGGKGHGHKGKGK